MIEKLDLPTGLPRGKAGKAGKQSLQYLGIVVIVAILVSVGSFYYLSLMPEPEIEMKPAEEKPTGRTMEEIIRSLSVPEGSTEPISDELQKSLSAPSGQEGESTEVSEDIIESLTAPK